MNAAQDLCRRLTPVWVRDAMAETVRLLPGQGMYRADRVRLYSTFVLQAVGLLALGHNLGAGRTAAALRRLADLLENGEAHRLVDALNPEAEAAG